jgi:hypothetical protein
MISTHKIQERLAAYRQLYNPLHWDRIAVQESEVLKDQENYVKRASKLLDTAVKFDMGEIEIDNSQALFDTGKECVEEGLFSLPFEEIYVEATLVNNIFRERFGLLFIPVFKCLDEVALKRQPEFVGGTAALNFVRKGEFGPALGSWEIPTLLAVFSRDFKETSIVPAAKELADYAALTEEQCRDIVHFNTTILYIIHSLINARGVQLLYEPAPLKLNRRRAKKNKPPLYEHRVLKIGGYSSSGQVLGVGATHASPRAHWRRGHIRTIRGGTIKQKQILIPASLINGPGFVSKDYEISQ